MSEQQPEPSISFTALLSVLERLKSKNRNPERDWYLGWNAALDCLINDIQARSTPTPKAEVSVSPATPEMTAELKACPFCNAQPDPPYTNNVGGTYAKINHKKDCIFAFGQPREQWLNGMAFERWNTRADSNAAEITALKAKIEKLETVVMLATTIDVFGSITNAQIRDTAAAALESPDTKENI